jgi:hypothetical protein
MSDTSISNVMAIRAEVIARSRALREAQPTAPPSVAPTTPASSFADTLNAVVAKVNETRSRRMSSPKHMSVARPPTLRPSRSCRAAHP